MLRTIFTAICLLYVHVIATGAAVSATRPSTQSATTTRQARENRRVHVIVIGRVQGVGFRAFTQETARSLGLRGYVLNRADGSVEAVIEGPNDKVARLLELLKRGPLPARVDKLRITDESYKGEFRDFEIRGGNDER